MTPLTFVFSDARHRDASVIPLDGLGLIRAAGPEARSFLQGQLTNDAKLLRPAQAQLSGYCSPKGRLLAVFTVLQLGEDDFALALPASLLTPTLKRLKMFVLRSKLTLVDASAELPALGLYGEQAAAALAAQAFTVPEAAWGLSEYQGIWLLRCPGPVPRFELRAAPGRLTELQQSLALPTGHLGDWALAEVLAGTPQVMAETSDHFVPQTIDLDTRGGVSFTKGCYPGQEIVARVHYLGRVKQRLRMAAASAALAPGTAVMDQDGHSLGEVMAAAAHPHGGAALALSLNLAHSGADPLQTADGAVTIRPQALI